MRRGERENERWEKKGIEQQGKNEKKGGTKGRKKGIGRMGGGGKTGSVTNKGYDSVWHLSVKDPKKKKNESDTITIPHELQLT